ncbi:MAG: hypothetical protein ACLP5H_23625 [Desulfomonilaceae bacterium]
MPTRVIVLENTSVYFPDYGDPGAELCLQWAKYVHEDGTDQMGYRFMWRVNGTLQAHRGQARMPSRSVIDRLFEKAKEEGWGEEDTGERWIEKPPLKGGLQTT